MMRLLRHPATSSIAAALLIALAYWFSQAYFEKYWEGVPYASPAALENRLLAAERYLAAGGYTVKTHDTLGAALQQLPEGGAMLISNRVSNLPKAQVDQLLDWVARGGVLITRPDFAPDSDAKDSGKEGGLEQLPLSGAFDTWLHYTDDDERADEEAGDGADELPAQNAAPAGKPAADYGRDAVLINFPGIAYPLLKDAGSTYLARGPKAPQPLWQDADDGEFLLAYAHGKGQLILLNDLPFANGDIRRFDHAELLGKLVALAPKRSVALVLSMDQPRWYQVLIETVPLGLIASLILLLVGLWVAMPRFGPLLPEPASDRRALLEHVEAAGRWLWQSPLGREKLLQAVRQETRKLLFRRWPQWQRLPDDKLHAELAREFKLDAATVEQALQWPAARIPIDFTRQIRTLQLLRQHHDR
ncbi:DUF4350 domain-containing protein [Chitinimonas sp.]|uniref:DUF4350 domain-containing protein n=1 Tax=Chitinimonas sp. TaxID=1934313 RepID=UPI0035B2CBB4